MSAEAEEEIVLPEVVNKDLRVLEMFRGNNPNKTMFNEFLT